MISSLLPIYKAIAKRKKVPFVDVFNVRLDSCNIMFNYINRNGKIVNNDMYSYETLGIKKEMFIN